MSLLGLLIQDKLDGHPLPWTIEYDWCVELYDAKENLVMKMRSDAMAREFIAHAERLKAESDAFEIEFERMMNEPEQ